MLFLFSCEKEGQSPRSTLPQIGLTHKGSLPLTELLCEERETNSLVSLHRVVNNNGHGQRIASQPANIYKYILEDPRGIEQSQVCNLVM